MKRHGRWTMRRWRLVLYGLVLLVLDAGCMCCSTADPYDEVQRGDSVYFRELTPPDCYACTLKIDVVNSHRTAVRQLYEGDPDDLSSSAVWDPVEGAVLWDTRDDAGRVVPEDIYVIRAWQDNERYDSWVVLVYD
jgi:hypothetical protein